MFTWKKWIHLFMITSLFTVGPVADSFADQAADERIESSYSPLFIVQFAGREWTLNLNDVGFDGIDPTTLDRQAFMNWFHLVVEKEVNRPPRSAYFKGRKIVPHQLGRTIDREQVTEWLDQIHDYINRPVPLPVIWTQPALSTNQVKRLKEKKLGSYTTYFNPNNRNRSHNIELSTQAIDHFILMPGEIFSFNRVVGERSIKKGYRPARIIVKGEYSEGVGGGVCQTSSTLFNSVDAAGLRIIQRVSHSKQVTYVPEHRDATVSWGGPDFKFQNQLNEPILIVATIKKGMLKISVYGPRKIHYHPRFVPPSPKFSQVSHPVEMEQSMNVREKGPLFHR
ncbi:VanW family protein [Lihuaxuella thermophila]|uniref:VanW like protein n=1 Tax=Lihuaxuella thermophila TaxID=1173111 RepID=A0A1H8DHP0_9BACL|nr:VanW family protein [Lihuaxuella thermophila]SEN06831.1 VanW like protein [Lihuaxuella thermophila]